MKTLQELVDKNFPEDTKNVPVELLIRRGRATSLKSPESSQLMTCQDCGGKRGHTCFHYGKRAWFCGNLECLQKDTGIKLVN